MTVYASLRAALVAVLEAVADIGVVHDRERFAADPSAFLDYFKTTIGGVNQIRAWLVLRESVQPVEPGAFGESRRRHLFILRGYLGFQDAADSYGTLQGLVDAVLAALDDQTTLSTGGVVVRAVGPCALRGFENVQFGSILCHQAEIEVPIETLTPFGTA